MMYGDRGSFQAWQTPSLLFKPSPCGEGQNDSRHHPWPVRREGKTSSVCCGAYGKPSADGQRSYCMGFYDVLDQIQDLLRRRGRVTYRALKREFNLDDEFLDDLKEELIYGQKLAVDED